MGKMARGTWKAGERRVAAYFGTLRTSLSGGNSKITRSDTMHPRLFIETKHRASHAVRTLYDETAKQAKVEGKTPVVALIDKNKAGFLVVVHSDYFADLCKESSEGHSK